MSCLTFDSENSSPLLIYSSHWNEEEKVIILKFMTQWFRKMKLEIQTRTANPLEKQYWYYQLVVILMRSLPYYSLHNRRASQWMVWMSYGLGFRLGWLTNQNQPFLVIIGWGFISSWESTISLWFSVISSASRSSGWQTALTRFVNKNICRGLDVSLLEHCFSITPNFLVITPQKKLEQKGNSLRWKGYIYHFLRWFTPVNIRPMVVEGPNRN